MLDVLNKKKIEINKEKEYKDGIYIYTDFWLTPRIILLNLTPRIMILNS